MDADEMLKNIENLDVDDAIHTAMLRNRDKAANILREQLEGGESAKGMIGKYKDADYAQMKFEMNPRPGYRNVDLKLTGSFHDKIRASVTEDELTFNSFDSKTQDLVKKYSAAILDLNGQNMSTFAEEIEDDFHRVITQITGLEFTP